MKKVMFLFLAVVPLMLQSQVDTLFMGDREPTFYYWGDWWLDYVYAHTDEEYQDEYLLEGYHAFHDKCKPEVARCCYSSDTLKIIGVAVAAKIGIFPKDPPEWLPVRDSSILPEYCRIFKYHGPTEEQSPFLAEARYDDFVPRYKMYVGPGYYASVYEAYFKSPVTVVDTFYVSATENNNYRITDTFWIPFLDTIYMCPVCRYSHPLTGIYNVEPYPVPGYDYYYHFGTNLVRYQYEQPAPSCNELWDDVLKCWKVVERGWFYDEHGNHVRPSNFIFIFPIYDTSTFVDTAVSWCMAPNNLRAPMPDAESTVLLWNAPSGSEWDVSLCKECTVPDSGVITHYTTTFANLPGLEAGATYTAWVRAYCNESDTSFWSVGLEFTVPLPADTGGTGLVFNVDDAYFVLSPNPASERVSAFSSFQIRELDIYSMSGTLVRHESPRALSVTLDISDLPRGLYIVRAITAHGMAYARLIIQ